MADRSRRSTSRPTRGRRNRIDKPYPVSGPRPHPSLYPSHSQILQLSRRGRGGRKLEPRPSMFPSLDHGKTEVERRGGGHQGEGRGLSLAPTYIYINPSSAFDLS